MPGILFLPSSSPVRVAVQIVVVIIIVVVLVGVAFDHKVNGVNQSASGGSLLRAWSFFTL